jgi:hypothetical protein
MSLSKDIRSTQRGLNNKEYLYSCSFRDDLTWRLLFGFCVPVVLSTLPLSLIWIKDGCVVLGTRWLWWLCWCLEHDDPIYGKLAGCAQGTKWNWKVPSTKVFLTSHQLNLILLFSPEVNCRNQYSTSLQWVIETRIFLPQSELWNLERLLASAWEISFQRGFTSHAGGRNWHRRT